MDMSKHPQIDTSAEADDPRHSWSNPGATVALLIALAWIMALAAGFLLGGLAGLVSVKVALVPVLVIVLATITIGR